VIASLAAAGRRILFAAEEKAALDVVKLRLEEVGLGHLAIVLHGADLSPKKVMQQVAHTLEVVRTAVTVDCAGVHSQLVDRRPSKSTERACGKNAHSARTDSEECRDARHNPEVVAFGEQLDPVPCEDLSVATAAAIRGLATAQNQNVHRTSLPVRQSHEREPRVRPRCLLPERFAQMHR
jgi:hypothetical protein